MAGLFTSHATHSSYKTEHCRFNRLVGNNYSETIENISVGNEMMC